MPRKKAESVESDETKVVDKTPKAASVLPEWKKGDKITAERLNEIVRAVNGLIEEKES